METLIIRLSKKDKRNAQKTANRNVDLELEFRIPAQRVHKNKKAYNRKEKHKQSFV